MTKLIIPLCILILSTPGLAQIKQQIWTAADRQNLIVGLKNSQSKIAQEVEGLNERQMTFKPDSNQWSIAEVIEHIAVYEELLYWDLLNNQYTPERPELVDSVKGIDSTMLAYATDPNRGQAPFAVQPMGRFQKKADLLIFFNRYRNEVIKLIEETKVDFRLHFIFRPADWGVWHIRDLHQYTLLWIAHTDRHLNQIKRIENSPKFPK
ncbi:MAG: DinB family protein [Ferruginibacter sp.]|jgi:hypothetical protein